MLYEVETTYDSQTLYAFQLLLNGTIRRRKYLAARAMAFILGIACILDGLLWLWVGAVLVPMLSSFLTGAIFLLAGFFFPRYVNRRPKQRKAEPETIRYRFYPGKYVTKIGKTNTESDYSVIRILCQNEGYYAVMLDRRQGFLLDKSRFLTGDPDTFGAFISQKTGKPLQHSN